MKQWYGGFLLVIILFGLLISGCSGGGNNDEDETIETVYYDGKITVTTNGTDDTGFNFNEKTTISEFKLYEMTGPSPDKRHFETDNFMVEADVQDSDPKNGVLVTFSGKFQPANHPSIILDTNKPSGTFTLMVPYISAPNAKVVDVLGEHDYEWPLQWVDPGENPLPDDSPTPLVIRGELTQTNINGLATKISWDLSRHIVYN